MHVERTLQHVILDVGLAPLGYLAYLRLDRSAVPLRDAKQAPFEDTAERLCLIQGVPVDVAIADVNMDEKKIHVKLSQAQMDSYQQWLRMLLERIIAVNCTRRKLKNALANTRNMRFIVSVDRLGLFCQNVVCKLGVDVERIQAALAREIPEASFCIFSPSRQLRL